MPATPFFHYSGLACSWVPLSGEGSLLSAPSCQPLESETGPDSVVENTRSDALPSAPFSSQGVHVGASTQDSLCSRHAGGGKKAQTVTGAGAEPGPQRAAVARWVCGMGPLLLGLPRCGSGCSPGRRGPQRRGQAGPPDLRDAGAPPRSTAPPTRTPGPVPEPAWMGRETAGHPHGCAPTSTPGLGRCVQSPASCTCRSEFMNLLNLAFNSIQVQMTSN